MGWKGDTFTGVIITAAGIGVLCLLISIAIYLSTHTYITVNLVNARGLDADEETGTTPVEFDVAIGFLNLQNFAVGHDGGQVTISYAGVKLAEGSVPKFYVAGGLYKKRVEATTAVASAGKDQAPLPQVFRDHIWVDQQLHGEAEFDVALSFTDVNITTGEITHSHHYCKAGFAPHGKSKPSKCGEPESFLDPHRHS